MGTKTNEDFRKLLAESRNEDRKKKGHSHKGKSHKPKRKEGQEGEEKEDKYRDRAAERRLGKTEYDDLNKELDINLNTLQGVATFKRMTIEESKFLGGDERSTHLVKGLDFALLRKQQERTAAIQKEADVAAAEAKAAEEAEKEMTFKTPMARRIYDELLNPKKAGPMEVFLPGRAYFDFNLDDTSTNLPPPRVVRSKHDANCPSQRRMIMGVVDHVVLAKMAKVLAYIRPAAKDRKKARKGDKARLLADLCGGDFVRKAAAPAPHGGDRKGEPSAAAAPADPDEDIFGDAGDDYAYQPRKAGADARDRGHAHAHSHGRGHAHAHAHAHAHGAAADAQRPGGGYFNGANDTSDLPEPASAREVAGTSAADDRDAAWKGRKEPQDAKALKGLELGAGEDAYGELEQNAQYNVIYDSDEEDMSHMDRGKAKGMTASDFATEEEFNAYKQKMERLPKAAFQYGIKQGDGRKSSKAIVNAAARGRGGGNKDQKLNTQLNKIEKMFSAQGRDHSSAFGRGGHDDDDDGYHKRRRL